MPPCSVTGIKTNLNRRAFKSAWDYLYNLCPELEAFRFWMESELKKILSIWNISKNLDAVIWTDLNENFMAKLKQQFSLEILLYLCFCI